MYNSTDSNNLQHPFREQCSRLYKLGLSILPLSFGTKLAACKWKQLQTTRLTPDEIKSWCNKRLASTDVDIPFNIGIITGKLSGVVVVDADDDEAVKYVREHLPYTPIQVTSRKGCHFYYRYPSEGLVKNFQGGTLNGQKIDIRGEGGLTVGPGSVHATGFVYQFSGDWAKWSEMPSYNPAWLVPDKPIRTVNPEAVATAWVDTDEESSINLDARLAAWRELLSHSPGTTQGKGAIRYAFALACAGIHGCCLSVDEALPEFTRWGTKSSNQDSNGGYYPWTEAELLDKLEGASDSQPDKPRGWLLPAEALVSEDRLSAALGIDSSSPAPTAPQPSNTSKATISFFEELAARKPVTTSSPGVSTMPATTLMRRKRAFTPVEFLSIPPARYLIRKHLTEKSLGVVYGPSGAGKSFYAIEQAISVARGTPLFGIFPCQKAPVLYLVSEADGTFGVRLRAYAKFHNINLAELHNLHLLPEAFNFQDTDTTLSTLCDIMDNDANSVRPGLIVVDTLNKNINGDENSPQDMGKFIKTCDLMRKVFRAAVQIVHHAGKDATRGARGHSSLFAACDSVVKVEGAGTDDYCEIQCEKLKSAKPFTSYNLKKTVVEVDPLDEDNPDSLVLTYLSHASTVANKLEQFVTLFDNVPRTLQDAISGDTCNTLEKIQWTKATAKNKASEAVTLGLLAISDDTVGVKGKQYKYIRVNK